MGAVVASVPNVGSNHEIYDYKGVRFGLIDLGGQSSLRSSWNQYFADTEAIILVIDSNDAARMSLAKAELQKLVKAEVSCVSGFVSVFVGGMSPFLSLGLFLPLFALWALPRLEAG